MPLQDDDLIRASLRNCLKLANAVLPDERPTRGHPTNEDLFGGTPVRSGHFVTCDGFAWCSCRSQAIVSADQREVLRSPSLPRPVYTLRSDRRPRRASV